MVGSCYTEEGTEAIALAGLAVAAPQAALIAVAAAAGATLVNIGKASAAGRGQEHWPVPHLVLGPGAVRRRRRVQESTIAIEKQKAIVALEEGAGGSG
jgi:hypothetical protein